MISILVQLKGKKRWRNQDKIKLLLGRLLSMHWIFQCMVGHMHRIYLRSIPCTTRISRSSSHFGINPSNPPNSLLKQCETMIVNLYEGNVFGKINFPPSCSLFCSFSCQAFSLCSMYCLITMILVEMSWLNWIYFPLN